LVILVGLFLFQKRGTAGVGAVFGPVMLIWFLTISVLGLNGILRYPGIVGAVLPTHAIRFFAEDPGRGLLVLGAVFLAVTGGEALYADLGHFGHSAIQLAWFTVPLPALLLNYFGQGAMLLTTVMFYVMSREVWGWSLLKAASVSGLFLVVDLTFLVANALKIWHGGWVPLAIAIVLYFAMSTWKRGREILSKRMMEKTVPLKLLLADLAAEPPVRVPGTAVFMYGSADGTPPALVLNLTHNKVLHEKIVFLTITTED